MSGFAGASRRRLTGHFGNGLYGARPVLGRNHALYAATVWLGAYPVIAAPIGLANPDSFSTMAVTTVVAAGAGVLPDLDHPDARPSRHFGPLSRLMAHTINSATGGHRVGTHSLACAAVVGLIAWACHWFPDYGGRPLATVACGFCASIGLALVGPSLGRRIHPTVDFAVGVGVGWWVWSDFDRISAALWVLAAGGVIVHCLCDAVTKGGVPLFLPITRKRFKLGLFAVGGPGETIAAVVGVVGFAVSVWNVLGGFRIFAV